MKTLKLDEIVGFGEALTRFVNAIEKAPVGLSPDVAIMIARDCVKSIATTNLAALVTSDIQDMYDNHVMIHGELPENPRTFQVAEWQTPLEAALDAYFDEYSKFLSASWLATVDTLTPTKPEDIEKICDKFAAEAWRHLIAYHDEEDDTVKEKSAAQVLSAVGILRSDIEAILKDRQPPKEDAPIMDYDPKTLIHDLHEFVSMTGITGDDLKWAVDNATDSNDIIADSGLAALGAASNDRFAMRDMRKRYGVEHLAVMIENDTYAAAQDAPPVDEAAELATMMGGVEIALNESGYAKVQIGEAPPPPAKRGPQPSDFQTPAPTDSGVIPAAVLRVVKEYTNVKSETVGEALGVTRATFDNYAKGKTARLHATHENKAYLKKLLDEHIDQLSIARDLLAKVG